MEDGPETSVATNVFMIMPPTVLPAATTLNTVPTECFGTTSTTIALRLINHASAAMTTRIVRAIAVLTPSTREMKNDTGMRHAQPSMIHIRLVAGALPR